MSTTVDRPLGTLERTTKNYNIINLFVFAVHQTHKDFLLFFRDLQLTDNWSMYVLCGM